MVDNGSITVVIDGSIRVITDTPQANLEAVENREWLWSQPITTLELLHRKGSESSPGFSYKPHSAEGLGFKGLGFSDKEAPPPAPEKVNIYEFTEESF